jgi:nicotinate-nucleotide pyrophosphorylase (carboxylating)
MRNVRYPAQLPHHLIETAVRAALNEDLGLVGDLTSQATLAPDVSATAIMVTREAGTIAGLDLVEAAFCLIGPGLVVERLVDEASLVAAGTSIAKIYGNARLLFSAERVALNFLNHMSGIATHTQQFVAEIAQTGAKICDTRKTTPGMRAFEKYAVRCGGGHNHRFGLDDAILIKDNHIAVAGGIAEAISAAKAFAGHLVSIEVEVDTLDQFKIALESGATAILLDNMSFKTLRNAVTLNKGRARLEASGGVTLDSVREIAETGVDFISTSRITMASLPLDIGLDIKIDN